MEWLTENWFWVVIGVAFIAMHLFGHGGHGGHGGGDRQPRNDESEKDQARERGVNKRSGGISTEAVASQERGTLITPAVPEHSRINNESQTNVNRTRNALALSAGARRVFQS